MADLYATLFDFMNVNQMRTACDVLGIQWNFGNSTTVLRGRINRKLKERGQPNAKSLNDLWPATSSGYTTIESRNNPGMVLTLSYDSVALTRRVGANGSSAQQWRLTAGTTGSLMCKSDPSGRLIMSGTAVDKEHALSYGNTNIDPSASWVYDASAQTYCLREPWKWRGQSAILALTVNSSLDVVGSKYHYYAKSSQMWTCVASNNTGLGLGLGPRLSRTYTQLFGGVEPPLPVGARATDWALGRSRSDPQNFASLISLSAANERQIKRAFTELDTDGNGELTGKDFDNRMESESRRRSRHQQWTQIREYMDVNGNGRIDEEEFRVGCLRTAIEEAASTLGQPIYWSGNESQKLRRLQNAVNSNITRIVNAVLRKYR
jgi:hypothetical protein